MDQKSRRIQHVGIPSIFDWLFGKPIPRRAQQRTDLIHDVNGKDPNRKISTVYPQVFLGILGYVKVERRRRKSQESQSERQNDQSGPGSKSSLDRKNSTTRLLQRAQGASSFPFKPYKWVPVSIWLSAWVWDLNRWDLQLGDCFESLAELGMIFSSIWHLDLLVWLRPQIDLCWLVFVGKLQAAAVWQELRQVSQPVSTGTMVKCWQLTRHSRHSLEQPLLLHCCCRHSTAGLFMFIIRQ